MHDSLTCVPGNIYTHAFDVEDVIVPAGARLTRHGHDAPHICFVDWGSFDERGVHTVTASEATVRTSPAGDEHDMRFNQDTRCVLLLVKDVETSALLPRDRRFIRSKDSVSAFRQVARSLSLESSPLYLELMLLEGIALLALDASSWRGTRPRWVEHARELLHDSTDDTRIAPMMSEQTGLHPVYVARAFRRWYGCSMSSYARRVRLERARVLIVGSKLPISQVAYTCGFADQSHLTRLFKQHLGISPAALRSISAA